LDGNPAGGRPRGFGGYSALSMGQSEVLTLATNADAVS